MAPATAPDPTRCPLCGLSNRCAMESAKPSGEPQPPGWCTQVDFSADRRARVPADAQGQACICPACAAKGAAS